MTESAQWHKHLPSAWVHENPALAALMQAESLTAALKALAAPFSVRLLHLGAVALSWYRAKPKMPLWEIGHKLKLVPIMIFNLQQEKLHPEEYAHEKATLATAARRLIRQAILIAENAARGRFFTDEKFPEAMVDTYQRKAGRPVGTTRKKTKAS